jgi:hypothetical protein
MPGKLLSFFYILFLCPAAFFFTQNNPDRSFGSSLRSFYDVFPSLDPALRGDAFSPNGYFISYDKLYQPLESSGIDPRIFTRIEDLNPSVVMECLYVVPYPAGPMTALDIYNGLRNIRALKGRLYHSATRDADIPLFEDASRLESPKRGAIAQEDPPPRDSLPDSETIYVRLKDANFGNSYYQADITKNAAGFTYCLSNNRDLSYLIVPIIKSGCFIAQFYFEPIQEGILVYSMSGARVSDFITSKTDMPSALKKRLELILGWVIDGVSGRLDLSS